MPPRVVAAKDVVVDQFRELMQESDKRQEIKDSIAKFSQGQQSHENFQGLLVDFGVFLEYAVKNPSEKNGIA